jgi:hypothetical protein
MVGLLHKSAFSQAAPRLGVIPGSADLNEDEDSVEAHQITGQGPVGAMDELAQEQAVTGEKLPQEQAPSERTPATKPWATRSWKKAGDAGQGPVKPKKAAAARSVPPAEKRKLQSQGEPDPITLPTRKRARGKSKSPPSGEGAKKDALDQRLAQGS